jgi:hypothetical protein
VFTSRSSIANVEVGLQVPARDFWRACDTALGCDGRLLGGFDELEALRRQHREQAADAASGACERQLTSLKRTVRLDAAAVDGAGCAPVASEVAADDGDLEEVHEIARRVQSMSCSNFDAATLEQLSLVITGIGRQYEAGIAGDVYRFAVRERRWIGELLDGRQRPLERLGLYAVAGRLSAMLGYLAFDLGRTDLARAYCGEAFALATDLNDGDLAAWVRGTQSLVEYYHGDYGLALKLARDGLIVRRTCRRARRLATDRGHTPYTRRGAGPGRRCAADDVRPVRQVHQPSAAARRTTIAHTDLQAHNILIGPTARFIDWAWPTLGAAWIDTACLALHMIRMGHHPKDAERWAQALPAYAGAGKEAVSALVTAHVAIWTEISTADSQAWKAELADAARCWALHRGLQ